MDAFLFDLDGTLVNSFEDIAHSVNYARQALGLPVRPTNEIHQYIGEGARRLIERSIGFDNQNNVSRALELWHEHYRLHMLDSTYVYAGIEQELANLNGFCAILTNKPGEHARQIVEKLGLNKFVQVVVGGGDVPTRKPDPAGVEKILSHLPSVDRVVLIGDSLVDFETAMAASIGFVGVLWGLGRKEDFLAAGARCLIDGPSQLRQACDGAALRRRI